MRYLLVAVVLLLASCGGEAAKPIKTVTHDSWVDGDPTVPVCPSAYGCKSGFEVKTAGGIVQLPLTTTTYDNAQAVRTVGLDQNGVRITSAWKMF